MKVLVFGLGRSGRDLLEFYKNRASLWVYDDKELDMDELEKEYPGIAFYDEKVDYDLVALSPGPQPDHWLLEKLRAKNTTILGELAIALDNIRGEVICITGTNGKTTTTSLVYEMLKKGHERTFVGGNIGIPLIGYARGSREGDIYVVEISSFQLESLEHLWPRVSAILNITPDHVSWHGSMDRYVDAKFKLWEKTPGSEKRVINLDQEFLLAEAKKRLGSLEDYYFFSTEGEVGRGAYLKDGFLYLKLQETWKLLSTKELRLKGRHNISNALAASLIAALAGAKKEHIVEVLREFSSLEHRYEVLGKKKSRTFINDSKATNVDSALPALKSAKRPTVLIAGGLDKKVALEPLFFNWNPNIKEVIVFGETGDYMYRLAKEVSVAHRVSDLEEAFHLALELSSPGWDILFSPACASWDMYKSYEERGQHFKDLYGGLDE